MKTRKELEMIAKTVAFAHHKDHDYLPKTPEEASDFVVHEWVIQAMYMAQELKDHGD